jgi:hypothetical protein
VRQGKVDPKGILEPPVPQVQKAMTVHPELKEILELPVLREIRGIQVTLVQKVQQEHPVQQAVQDQQDLPVLKEVLVQ